MPKDNPNHSLWSGLAWGWAFWTVAEFWWVILFHSGTEAPYPSGADIFWLLGYIPIFISFGLRIRSLPVVLTPTKKTISWVLSILILAFTGYAILWPVVRSLNAENLVRSFFDLFYPLADLALLLLVLRFFFTVPEGIYGQARLWVAIGYALRVVSDLVSSHLSGIGLYYPQGVANASSVFMVDLPYFAGYVCYLVGLLILYRMKQSYASFIKAESHPLE